MDKKKYKTMFGVFYKIFSSLKKAPRETMEDYCQEAIILYYKSPRRNVRRIAIDVLRASGAGRKRSRNYKARLRAQRTVQFNLKKHDRMDESGGPELPHLPKNFISRGWPTPIKTILRDILKGKKRSETALKLGVSTGRVSQILKENKPMLLRRYHECVFTN